MTGLFRMVAFSLNGVLTEVHSSWQAVNTAFGVDDRENLEKYLLGEIDYRELMRLDIELWGNPSIRRVRSILDQVSLVRGARESVQSLVEGGVKTIIISSGILSLAERVGEELGVDYVFANRLLVDERGNLTGDVEEAIDYRNTGAILEKISQAENIRLEDCVVIGSSRSYIPLFEKAGLSIAFNAQESLIEEAADVIVDGKDLRKILPWIQGVYREKAHVSFNCDSRAAEIIAKAISPENVKAPPGLKVRSRRTGAELKTKILCAMGPGTLLATLDDLLQSVQLGEKAVKILESI